jgi:hypothetical protein
MVVILVAHALRRGTRAIYACIRDTLLASLCYADIICSSFLVLSAAVKSIPGLGLTSIYLRRLYLVPLTAGLNLESS